MLARRLPRWQQFLLAFGLVLLLFFTGFQRVLGKVPKQLVELSIGALLVAAFLSHPKVAATRAGLGRRGALLMLGCPTALVIVDAAHLKSPSLYPLVGWEMFTAPMGKLPDPDILVLTAHYRHGGRERLIPGGVISDMVTSGLDGQLRKAFAVLDARPADERARAEATAVIRGLARMQEAAHPTRPISEVSVERCRMPVRPPYEASCQRIATFPGPTP
jgi:hypothetical protein